MVGRSCHNHASWSSHLQQMRSHRRLGSVHQWLLRWTWPAPSAKSRKGFMLQGCKNDPTLAHTHILGKGQTHGTFLNGITGIWLIYHRYEWIFIPTRMVPRGVDPSPLVSNQLRLSSLERRHGQIWQAESKRFLQKVEKCGTLSTNDCEANISRATALATWNRWSLEGFSITGSNIIHDKSCQCLYITGWFSLSFRCKCHPWVIQSWWSSQDPPGWPPWSPHHLKDHGVPGQRQGQVENRFDQLGAQWRIPDFQRKNAGRGEMGWFFQSKNVKYMPGAGASLANVHAELSYFESESIILIIEMIIISSIMIIIYIYIL